MTHPNAPDAQEPAARQQSAAPQRTRSARAGNSAPAESRAVAVIEFPAEQAAAHNIDEAKWAVLTRAIFPGAKTQAAVLLALDYCAARGLDPFKRPVHIVPVYDARAGGMVETIWPGIAEIRTTAVATRDYAGMEDMIYGPMVDLEFRGKVEEWVQNSKSWTVRTVKLRVPEWIQIAVWRLDATGTPRRYAGPRAYFLETYAPAPKQQAVEGGYHKLPNSMWERRPIGQLQKCAEAGGLRMAFPTELGGIYAAEEMEGQTIDHYGDADDAPAPPPAARSPAPPPKALPRGAQAPVSVPAKTIEATAVQVEKQPAKPPTGSPFRKAAPPAEPVQELALNPDQFIDGIEKALRELSADDADATEKFNSIIEMAAGKSDKLLPADQDELAELFERYRGLLNLQ